MLLRKFSMCSSQVKCHLCRSYCANMHYPYFWFNNKLQIYYNNSLRRLLSIPKRSSASEMFVDLNIPAFCERMRKCVLGFCFRLEIILLGLLLGHLLFIIINVGSGGTRFCIDMHFCTGYIIYTTAIWCAYFYVK